MLTKTYLGDGLYAQFDGETVIFSTGSPHPTRRGDEATVYLNRDVLKKFTDWSYEGFPDYNTGENFPNMEQG